MATDLYQQQINNELKSMDQRLYDLEEKMASIDGKLTQVVDAILGNPLTKSGGFVDKIEVLEEKIALMEKKIERQDEFRRKITWTAGIIIGALMLMEYVTKIYTSLA
jgi:uncharacterized coiled-coil protein SlyX